MVALSTIRSSLQTRLQEISGLQVYDVVPDSIEPPCAVVGLVETVGFNQTFGPTKALYTFPVRIYVSKADAEDAQLALDPFVAPTGTQSVKATIEDKTVTVSAGWDFVNVSEARGYGVYRIGDIDYLGIEYEVQVVAS